MKSIQKKVLEKIEEVATSLKLEPTIRLEWANTGTVFFMNENLKVFRKITFSFQGEYATIGVYFLKNDMMVCIKEFHHLDYVNFKEWEEFFLLIRTKV